MNPKTHQGVSPMRLITKVFLKVNTTAIQIFLSLQPVLKVK
jgi:hypothetical protein